MVRRRHPSRLRRLQGARPLTFTEVKPGKDHSKQDGCWLASVDSAVHLAGPHGQSHQT